MNNRELKFRIWSKEENSFVNPNILEVWNESGELSPFQYIKTGKLSPIYMPINNYIIQQFTGIKDKNGKDIYEGDIITGDFNFGPAGYVKQTLPVHWHNTLGYQWNYWYLNTIEIIGNIFQHPELLNNSKFPKQPYDHIYSHDSNHP